MARPFSQLPKYIGSIGTALAPALVEVHKKITEAGLVEAVNSTPVDTTRAVSNWQVSINSPNTREVPPRAVSVKGSGAGAARAATITVGKSKLSALQYMQTAFVANSVPYIGLLENGGPRHRANNMTSKAMQAMVAYAKTVKLKIVPRG